MHCRKSGERKQNRVTFEDSRDENDGPDAMVRTPERSSKERQRQPKPDQTSDCGTTPQDTPENMRRNIKENLRQKFTTLKLSWKITMARIGQMMTSWRRMFL